MDGITEITQGVSFCFIIFLKIHKSGKTTAGCLGGRKLPDGLTL